MATIIDSHAHVLPDLIEKSLGSYSSVAATLKNRARSWLKPYYSYLHTAQTGLRHLPEAARRPFDELGAIAPLFNLLLESNVSDLKKQMNESGVTKAALIAHPPMISNEFILKLAKADKSFLPVVNIPRNAPKPADKLREFIGMGAKCLKIHAASDGEDETSKHYLALLEAASQSCLPVIIHTGCMHSRLLYRDSRLGEASRFEPWFKSFPKTKFILAHMNFHEPQKAIAIGESYLNVYVDTSWQPAEIIGEAAHRLGAERVLFGSDWPIVGNNLSIGLKRIRECVTAGALTETQADLIMGKNAESVFAIE